MQRTPSDSDKRMSGYHPRKRGVLRHIAARGRSKKGGWAGKMKGGLGPSSARQRGEALGANAPRPCQRQNVSPHMGGKAPHMQNLSARKAAFHAPTGVNAREVVGGAPPNFFLPP